MTIKTYFSKLTFQEGTEITNIGSYVTIVYSIIFVKSIRSSVSNEVCTLKLNLIVMLLF